MLMRLDIELSENDVQRVAEATAKIVLAAIRAGTIEPTPRAAEPALIDEKQAAAMLGVSNSTIWNYTKSGKLAKQQSGKIVRFAADDVRALLK